MTEEQAQRLGSYVLDAGLDAHILSIEDGRAFCVRILNPQWHCWSFDDWTQFCKEGKKQRKAQRREAMRAVDPQETYRLVMA